MTDRDAFASNLRHAAFPGACDWSVASDHVKQQWRNVANTAEMCAHSWRDETLTQVMAKLVNVGMKDAAGIVQQLRIKGGKC